MKNYLSEMLYALTSAYSRKDYDNHQQGRPLETNIGKLFSLFAWGLDIVQENAELVKQWDDLEAARGAVLDRYGPTGVFSGSARAMRCTASQSGSRFCPSYPAAIPIQSSGPPLTYWASRTTMLSSRTCSRPRLPSMWTGCS